MVARVGGEGGGSDYQGDSGREFWEVMAEFCSLFLVAVSQLYIFVKTQNCM